jgi:hypothetical protein
MLLYKKQKFYEGVNRTFSAITNLMILMYVASYFLQRLLFKNHLEKYVMP